MSAALKYREFIQQLEDSQHKIVVGVLSYVAKKQDPVVTDNNVGTLVNSVALNVTEDVLRATLSDLVAAGFAERTKINEIEATRIDQSFKEYALLQIARNQGSLK
jgi:hypothetical protein